MSFRQFNKLNVPEIWERYFTKYPQGMTILESLFEWVSQVDDMTKNVNDWNNYLKAFTITFDKELQSNVIETLKEWQLSGFLDVVINQALQTRLDDITENIVTIKPSGGDDTQAIQTVLNNNDIPRLIDGVYTVSFLTLDDNAKIMTSGYKTTLQQKSGQTGDIRLLNIIGSNVVVDEMKYKGNILTDDGEQRHAVYIRNNTKQINNVTVKGIKATDLRGDGLYIGGSSLYNPTNISIGDIHVTNAFRNGVSITGGKNIIIGNILALDIGLMGVDLESDTQRGHINNVQIGNIITSSLGIIASGTGYEYVENVEIGFVELRKDRSHSYPDYPYFTQDQDAVTFRNARNITIKGLDIAEFERFAIMFLISTGDRYSDNIKIGYLRMNNCSLTDTTYNSYLNITGVNRLSIDYLNSYTNDDKIVLQGSSATAVEQNVTVLNGTHKGGLFAKYCGLVATNLKAESAVQLFQGLKALSSIKQSVLKGTVINSYSTNTILEANDITFTTAKESGGVNIYKNNVVNGTFTP